MERFTRFRVGYSELRKDALADLDKIKLLQPPSAAVSELISSNIQCIAKHGSVQATTVLNPRTVIQGFDNIEALPENEFKGFFASPNPYVFSALGGAEGNTLSLADYLGRSEDITVKPYVSPRARMIQ